MALESLIGDDIRLVTLLHTFDDIDGLLELIELRQSCPEITSRQGDFLITPAQCLSHQLENRSKVLQNYFSPQPHHSIKPVNNHFEHFTTLFPSLSILAHLEEIDCDEQ